MELSFESLQVDNRSLVAIVSVTQDATLYQSNTLTLLQNYNLERYERDHFFVFKSCFWDFLKFVL